MSKYIRHQSAISRNIDEHISEDHWLKKFENNLQKGAVQPRSQQSVYDQINTIMNGTGSKFHSVQSAVDDMMQRSGLTNYLKVSNDKEKIKSKTAAEKHIVEYKGYTITIVEEDKNDWVADISLKGDSEGYMPAFGWTKDSAIHGAKKSIDKIISSDSDQNNDFDKTIPIEQKQENTNTPDVIIENPDILKTLENCIRSNRGNLPVPTIISRIRSIHQSDISDDKKWDDDKLIRLVSKLNLQAKKDNPSSYENYNNLGSSDRDNAESDVDPSNTDAFNALMPAKI